MTDLCREHGFSKSAFYKWRAKYGGMDTSALKRLKELEEENRKLKEMYADISLKHKAPKDIVEKKFVSTAERRGPPTPCSSITSVSARLVNS